MLLDTLAKTLEHHVRVRQGAQWVVAVSGGPDSLALLHALLQLQPRLNLRLHVATFDHQLRGDDGASDVAFVRDISAGWGVPVTTGRADVRALAADQRLSIEAAARMARYRFLARVARDTSATHIATAHNADDQAETVLMHVLRGAGLVGLSGMRVLSPLPEAPALTLVRPLLDVTRVEIEAYCLQHQLAPRFDVTNDVPVYLRNRLRLEVMPLLREINPQVGRQLRQLADISATDADYIEEAFTREIAVQATVSGDWVKVPLAQFRQAHPALQRRFVVWAARQLSPSTEVSYIQQVEAAELALTGSVGQRVTLPDALQLRVDYEAVVVESVERAWDESGFWLAPGTDIALPVPGVCELAGWTLVIATEARQSAGAQLAVPEGARLRLRTRRPGDRFAPLGLGGHTQKLKNWLIDHKVPRRWRDHLPLVEVNNELAALILGERWPVSERYAVRHPGETVVSLAATPLNIDP